MTASEYVSHLKMLPHPEGGFFAEHYRSDLQIDSVGFGGMRSACTSIYFLLEKGNFSALHRIKSDEIWHFYDGDPLEIIEISEEGELTITHLGRNLGKGENIAYTVKAGQWFGSRVKESGLFSLVGCTVAPGFDFQDFEMPSRAYFEKEFPKLKSKIQEFTRL